MKALLVFLSLLCASSVPATTAQPAPLNVLLVGNSLTYANNLPALFNALAAGHAGPRSYHADLVAAPGGSIAERWQDGVVADELASGNWQVLVLQERGGLLACLGKPGSRESRECSASVSAHEKFARLAKQHGVRVILLGTWGPDSIWQAQLSRGLRKLASVTGAEVLDLGPPVRAYAKAHPQTPMYSDALLHPTLDTSLLMAIALYRRLANVMPEARDLQLASPLLPVRTHPSPHTLFSRQAELGQLNGVTRIAGARLRSLGDAIADEK